MKPLLMRFMLLFLVLNLSLRAQESHSVSSPNGVLKISFMLEEGMPFYTVERFGETLIAKSRLGLVLREGTSFDKDLQVAESRQSDFDETWTQPWGEEKNIRNHYREMQVDLRQKSGKKWLMTLFFRAYDDGVAFRYLLPKQKGLDKIEVMDELSEFNMTGDHTAWWIPAYQWNRYEYLYTESPISAMDTVHTPVTFETRNGIFMSIHEAALTNYTSMAILPTGDNRLKCDLIEWSDGVKVKATAPMKSPWRTVQIADNAGGLMTSYLILNLNEPNKLGDVSWVKPGKYVGIWWEMHLAVSTWGSGEHHGATTENTKKYIDFAAENGFDGVLVEGWNIGWDGDWIANGNVFSFTKAYPDFDIEALAKYAADKGVRLIGHHETSGGIANYENQMEDAFKLYQRLGYRAVKTGYVRQERELIRLDDQGKEHLEWHHGQYMVEHYRRVVELAAKYKIAINAHEPIKDTGIRRTYPNMMSREGARGQEFNAWSNDGGNPPEHTTILPFTRFLAGPMDFTPGIFDLLFEEAKPNNRVNTTLTKQLALYVVLYGPLQMAADLPENYRKHMDAFQFIKDVAVDWETTLVPHAQIGDYVTVVRKDRHSDDWFLGSLTDEEGRLLEVKLDFLDQDKNYVAEIYRDGENGHWKTNPYDYVIERKVVNFKTTLPLRLAAGGGTAIRFRPATASDM